MSLNLFEHSKIFQTFFFRRNQVEDIYPGRGPRLMSREFESRKSGHESGLKKVISFYDKTVYISNFTSTDKSTESASLWDFFYLSMDVFIENFIWVVWFLSRLENIFGQVESSIKKTGTLGVHS